MENEKKARKKDGFKKREDRGNDRRRDRRPRKNNFAVDSSIRFVPNGYAMDITLTNKNNIPEAILRELKQHPAQYGVPYYVCKRFYMKTICNMVNDLTDIIVYRGNYSILDTENTRIEGDTSREFVRKFFLGSSNELLNAYKAFEAAADRKTQGVKIDPPSSENQYSLTCEGELVTWIVNRNARRERYELDSEYTVIEKSKLEAVVNWFSMLVDMATPNNHQFAAISYLEAVVEGRYFYDKSVFGYR